MLHKNITKREQLVKHELAKKRRLLFAGKVDNLTNSIDNLAVSISSISTQMALNVSAVTDVWGR